MTTARPPSEARPWHAAWPGHVPRSFEYPSQPAWWLLERNVERFADRIAVRELDPATLTERRVVSYGELGRAVKGTAAALGDLGVDVGTRVGFALPNSVALVTGFYATWWAGGTAVPTNPGSPEPELEQQFKDSGVSVVVAAEQSPAHAVAERHGLAFLDVERFHALAARPPRPPRAVTPADDVAVLLYTGGTTGSPKGAMLTHRNLVANTIQFAEWYAFAAGDEVSIAAIPMFHSGGMSGVMNVPLAAAGTLLVFPRFNAGAVARAVTRYRATRLFGVPTMFIALLNDDEGRRADYGALRACRTNAAALPPAVKAGFDELVGREVLVEGYGLTETSPLTHANPVGRAKAGSIGIPLSDTDARIVDVETGADVAPGQPGELLIRGPQVMRGYWNRPAETAQAMRNGWFATGDIARMDDEGYFAIVDRKKDMINTAGFKVWPREVEETLYAHPGVKLAAVVGVADDYRGEAVKAYVVLKADARERVTEADLIGFCRQRLTGYKTPRAIEFRDELPITTTGKMLRRVLRDGASSG